MRTAVKSINRIVPRLAVLWRNENSVKVQVLVARIVLNAVVPTLEQGPKALYAIGVRLLFNVLIYRMVYCLMRIA